MKIKKGYQLKLKSGSYVIECKNKSVGEPFNSIVLTETSAFLWNILKEKEATKTQMLDALINNFDISTVLALGDIDVFVRTMKENGIIED